MASFISKLKKMPAFARQVALARKANVFDSARYHAANLDVPSAPNKALWHYVRFGISEMRVSGQGIVGDWLYEKLVIAQHILPQDVRPLMAQIAGLNYAAQTPFLEAFCERHGFLFDALQARRAFAHRDLAGMRAHLAKIDPYEHWETALPLHYAFAQKAGLQEGVETSLFHAIDCLTLDHEFSFEFYQAIVEIERALGQTSSDDQTSMHRILEHMELSDYSSDTNLREDLWKLGLPICETESPLGKVILEALPPTLQTTLLKSPPLPHADIQLWHPVLTAMSANVLGLGSYCVRADGAEWHIEKTRPTQNLAQIRIMPLQYWVGAKQNESFSQYLSAFKKCVRALEPHFDAFAPVPSGQIYDITQTQSHDQFILGYHSYTTNSKPAIHIKESALPGYYTFDNHGFSGWMSPNAYIEVTDFDADALFDELRATYVTQTSSKYEQPQSTSLPFSDGFIFFPLQVPTDSVMQLARVDIFDALETLLSQEEAPQIVVKQHPKDMSNYTREKLEALRTAHPELIISTHAIHDLLAAARAVVTTNSGVGIEALLHLTPVITLGHSDYDSLGFPLHEVSNLLPTLEHALEYGYSDDHKRHVKRGLSHFFKHRCFHINDQVLPEDFYNLLPKP